MLLSRQGAHTEERQRLVRDLAQQGASVSAPRVDVSDERALTEALASIHESYPLAGVFHTAGVLQDHLIADFDAHALEETLRAKVEGALNLDRLTASLDLEAFVLYSSAAGVLGSPGQSAYASANAFLDGLAQRRRT